MSIRLRALARRTLRKIAYDHRNARYHFIHIPKNAGESVRNTLFLQRDISLSSPFHYRYVDIADHVGRHLRFFAVVRNPWSRTASRYEFARQSMARWSADDPRRRFIERASFEDFVNERPILPIPEHPGQPWMGPLSSWFDQLDWVTDEQGAVVCDCLRMEHLNVDLTSYLGRKLKMKRSNVTKAKYDYRRMYTDRLADTVSAVFSRDIDHFGFQFESPATRNVFGV